MGRCVIDIDQEYAPGCYLVCLVDENGEWDTRDEARTILAQVDFDFPSLAFNLGWTPCPCGATDGTVDCPHKTAEEMIAEAEEFLDQHLGEEFEDPGYFD